MTNKVLYSRESEDFYYVKVNVPCQDACPAYTNIPAYIRSLCQGLYDQSYGINRVSNILPGVLGRICSRPCEKKCRHGEPELGQPVGICHIKRAAADFRGNTPVPKPSPPPIPGKRIAIVGSGPAGLAAAHDLSYAGLTVTIFEAQKEPGGMLRYGIPEFRLPRSVLREEIEGILDLGIGLKTETRVGPDISLEDLLGEHDAVLLALGCYEALSLDVPGEDLPGVVSGLRFMMDICSGNLPPLGDRVLVIGAGFTAFDCARSALRVGAEEVTICLRRTEEDLVVTEDEIHQTKLEGIGINTLMVANRILGNGKVDGVEFKRTRPGRLRADGKREITPIDGSEFQIPADTVIVATGQRRHPISIPGKKEERGVLTADPRTFRTPIKGLYIAGDYLTGPSTVIEAIATGRKAASVMAEDLTGRRFLEPAVRMEETEITDRDRTWDFLPRQEIPTLQPVEERLLSMKKEVEKGYTQDLAALESKRCYLCYLHYEIDLDRCIYCRYCIDVAPRDCIKLVEELETSEEGAIVGFLETSKWKDVNAIVIDNSRCIRCGECMRVCPVSCISVTKVELVERSRIMKGG